MTESASAGVFYCLSPSQYDVSGTSLLGPDSSFYNQSVTYSVFLSWKEGLNYITAATEHSVS